MATAKIILHIRKKGDKDGYVKLRVTDSRTNKPYACVHKKDAADPTAINDSLELDRKFSKIEFDRIMNAKRRTDKEREYKEAFDSFLKKAQDCIRGLDVFTFEAFEALYTKDRAAKDTLRAAFKERSETLRRNGDISTAVISECAIISLEKYKAGLRFVDITPTFLEGYDKEMRRLKQVVNSKTGLVENKAGASPSTVSMYLRQLRTVFNDAIADGLISEQLYPFNRRKGSKSKTTKSGKKYSPSGGRKKKRAMMPDDLAALFHYESDNPSWQQSVDFWKLSYLCNGANFKDLLLLRRRNIDVDFIRFERAKTEDSVEEIEEISAFLEPEMRRIIHKYGVKNLNPESLIFPILTDKMGPETQYKKIQNFINFTNKKLALVCQDLGIKKVSTYWARHSFATTLKKADTNLELIRESLGHKSIKTTMNYLGSFDDDVKIEMSKSLIPEKPSKAV